jgi:hypothetical protein
MEHGQEPLATVVEPTETVAAMVPIPWSTQALKDGVSRVFALDKGCCQASRKAMLPVPRAMPPTGPPDSSVPLEQAELITTMQIAERQSDEKRGDR